MDGPILVIGATGFLGVPVVRHLQASGFPVRVMSRSGDRLREQFGDSFEIAIGDATNTPDMEKALEGCAAVHISMETEHEDIAVQNILSVAASKGLGRLTYLSGTTVFEQNSWFPTVGAKLRAEHAIRESGIPHTIFCPTWYMEMLPRLVRGNRAFTLGKQPFLWHFVAVDDFARMVARAYEVEEAVNKRFFVHGPEAFTIAEVLRRYCAALHPHIKNVTAMPIWMARVFAVMIRSKRLQAVLPLMAYFEKVPQGGDPGEANRILGAPTTTLEQWIEQQKNKK